MKSRVSRRRDDCRARHNHRRRMDRGQLSPEQLERRQMMAVTTFAEPSINGGWVTIVGESGDNIFLQNVAGVPNKLFVAGNSSFQDRTEVSGIDSIDKIIIASGAVRQDVNVLPTGYPMSAESETTFVLSRPWVRLSGELFEGTLSYVQADGSRSSWKFANINRDRSFVSFGEDVRFTTGIAWDSTAANGQVYPTKIEVVNDRQRGAPVSVRVTWNVKQLASALTMDSISWYYAPPLLGIGGGVVGGGDEPWRYDLVTVNPERITELALGPAAPRKTTFVLANAAGFDRNPVIPESFQGQLRIDGVTFDIVTEGPSRSAAGDEVPLRFKQGSQTVDVANTEGVRFGIWRKSANYNRYVTATLNPVSRTVTVTVVGSPVASAFASTTTNIAPGSGGAADPAVDNDSLNASFSPVNIDPGQMSMDAKYAVSVGNGAPVSATVFAGHDIRSALDVRLLTPGSTLNIDSPVRVSEGRSSGIDVQATNVNFNAVVSTNAGVSVGQFNLSSQDEVAESNDFALATATATAEIVGGRVTRLTVPPGMGGAGYDVDNPPVVTLSPPVSRAAVVRLGSLSNGIVQRIAVDAPGTEYLVAPTVEVSSPNGPGRQAQARATFNAGGVGAINVIDGGSGYTAPPTVTIRPVGGGGGSGARATAFITGSINDDLFVADGGFGYAPNSTLPVTFSSTVGGSGATGTAFVNSQGRISSVRVTSGGAGYTLNTSETQIVIPDPPAITNPDTATAVAVIDPMTTRIIGFTITNPGSRYASAPTVTVAAPIPASDASRAEAIVNAAGGISDIVFDFGTGLTVRVTGVERDTGAILTIAVPAGGGGSNYAIGDVVTLASGPAGTGRSARFRVASVDTSGAVQALELLTSSSGGTGYARDEVLTHVGSAYQGYGYTSAPRVFLDPPQAPGGRQAVAVADIDNAGRVTVIRITDAGSGYDPARPPAVRVAAVSRRATAETVRFNAPVAAGEIFDLRTADDPFTATERSLISVSTSGSLAGSLDGETPVRKVFVEAKQGDLLVGGAINGVEQSYLLQSDPAGRRLAPFRFTTTFAATGAQAGRIVGDTVAITLANDLDTPIQGAVAFNDLSLQTQVNSLRVRAARRDGSAVTNPYPYTLSLQETDDIAIDAVAASSFPIRLTAPGNMNFAAELATAGGLEITGVNALTVSAPVSTTRGKIALTARSIAVNSSLQVTEEDLDEARQDIVLTATNGDILLNGGIVSAVNRVAMNQTNRRGGPRVYATGPGSVPIADLATVQVPIAVSESFTFDDVKVRLSITHASNSDLSATLISPGGRRIRLFDGNASGRNFANTLFESQATGSISGSVAPYSGSFRPIDPFTPLLGQNAAGGWTLELVDSAAGGGGRVESVTLTFNDPNLSFDSRIGGSSIVVADTLQIRAQGAVGDPVLLPGAPTFHLRTNVNTVLAEVGGSFAIADADDVDIASLKAGGAVTLRADGVDRELNADGSPSQAALRGFLTDVRQLDVSAPRGSVDILVNSPGDVLVGNAQNLALSATARAGKVSAMQAAGSVRIHSLGGTTGGSFVVLDAPLAGSSAATVRYATQSPLQDVTYDPREAGLYPSAITANAPASLAEVLSGATTRRYQAPNAAVAIPDNRPTAPATMQINVADDFVIDDVNLTIDVTHRSLRDLEATLIAPNGVRIPLFLRDQVRGANLTGMNLDSEAGQALSRGVAPYTGTFRPLTSLASLNGLSAKGVWTLQVGDRVRRDAGTLNRFGLVFGARPVGPPLQVGDRVLVTRGYAGAVDDAGQPDAGLTANGVYVVQNPGSPTTRWRLVRAEEADTGDDVPSRTIVAVSDGPSAGKFFRLEHVVKEGVPFGYNEIEVTETPISTSIGSFDAGDGVTIVVSTPDGTNTSPGSLGKMIALRQANVTPVPQGTDFRFSTAINTPIRLQQELPAIGSSFAIDGARRYPQAGNSSVADLLGNRYPATAGTPIFIDGSQITRTRSNAIVGTSTVVNGIEFRPSSSGASLANVTMGGFRQGAAIVVNGASGVVIDGVRLGLDPTAGNARLANGSGVVVTASGAESVAGTTIRNSRIVASAKAGVSIEGSAAGVSLFGNTIGEAQLDNIVGVQVNSTGGGHAIGNVGQGRNVISFNFDGVVLAQGGATVANSTISNNTFDGIRISGGTHTVGATTARGATSNALFGNGRWGVSVLSPAVATAQRIVGNFFGVTNAEVAAAANRSGNIGIDSRAPAGSLGLTPNARTALDGKDNQHGMRPVTTTGTGTNPPPSSAPRRRRIWFA